MLPYIVNQQILEIVIVVRETFNDVEMVHVVFDLQIHVLHQARVVQQLIELPRLLFEGRTIVLPGQDVDPHSSGLEVCETIELR